MTRGRVFTHGRVGVVWWWAKRPKPDRARARPGFGP